MREFRKLAAVIVASAAIFPCSAFAAPAVDWDQKAAVAAPSAAGESLLTGFKALNEKLSAEHNNPVIYGVPQNPQDAFAGVPACSDVDAMFLRAFTIDEVVAHMAPCMQALSQRYALPVTIDKGAVGVDGGRGLAAGVLVRVPAKIMPGNHILMDLSYTIREKRHGRILGFPAAVISGTYDVHLPESAR